MTKDSVSLKSLKRWLRPIKRWLSCLVEFKSGILLSQVVDDGGMEPMRGLAKATGPSAGLPLSGGEYQRRTHQGNELYELVVEKQLVSWGWVAGPGTRIGVLHDLHLTVPERAFYIWDCATDPAFRGRGYFQALLAGILSAHRSTSNMALVAVDSRNEASRSALIKAGFRPRFTYFSFRVFGKGLFSVALKDSRILKAQPQFDGLNAQTDEG